MKYIHFVVIIFLLTACDYSYDIEDYNYLDDSSLRFIRREEDTSILINKNDKYYLLLLGNSNMDDIEVDYLIKYKNVDVDIDFDEEYLLNGELVINDLAFNVNDKIEIIMNDNFFCIYMKELDSDNYSECDFIYLYNPDSNFYITLNSDLKILFYHSYTKFNYRFLQHLATVWIDSYTIDSSSYTTLTIEQNYFEVVGTKMRGKTVHRR
ncbi:MAG: hypothetical protein IJZ46_01325 [Bacilli bacterium]|nr:hypothetical protein [Bacilli bacterium]